MGGKNKTKDVILVLHFFNYSHPNFVGCKPPPTQITPPFPRFSPQMFEIFCVFLTKMTWREVNKSIQGHVMVVAATYVRNCDKCEGDGCSFLLLYCNNCGGAGEAVIFWRVMKGLFLDGLNISFVEF